MVEVGEVFTREDGPVTRKMIKAYGMASKDKNPIHMSEDFANQMGLKGVIAHGMLFFGFVQHQLCDLADQWDGKYETIQCQMRGSVKPGDTCLTEMKVIKVEDKVVTLEINQYSKMPLTLTKPDGTVEKFEGEERGWVKEKELSGITEEDTPDGKLKYRKWISIVATATIRMG